MGKNCKFLSLKSEISNYVYWINYFLLFLIFNEIYMSSLCTILVFRFGGVINILLYAAATILFCSLQLRFPKEKSNQLLFLLFGFFLFIILFGLIRVPDYAYSDLKIIFMILVIIFGGRNTSWLRPFFNLMLCFGMVYVITTIWFSIDKSIYYSMFAENLYDPDDFVFYDFHAAGQMAGITSHYSMNGIMLANISILLFSSLWCRKKKFVLLSCFGFISSIVAIVLCGKRAHFLFTGVACLATFFIYFRKMRSGLLKILIFIPILLIAYYLFISTNTVFAELINRFYNLSKDSNVLIRLKMWGASMSGFKGNPFFGVGWYGAKKLTWAINGKHYWDSHNTYIQILCETGLIGAIFFFILLIFSLTKAIRLVKYCSKNNISNELRIYAIFSLTYQLFFLMYGMTGSTMQEIPLAGVYFVAVFISFHYTNVIKKNRNTMIIVPDLEKSRVEFGS